MNNPAPATAVTLRDTVATEISTIAPAVADRVVKHFVDTEVSRRTDLIVKGMDTLHQLNNDLRKINKPDVNTFNGDGSPAYSSFTKPRLDEVNKLIDRIAKLTKSIDAALNGQVNDLKAFLDKKGE